MIKHPHRGAARRRDFLKLAMTAGGTLALGGVVKATLTEPGPQDAPPATPGAKRGYRETPHVRDYYAKARI